MAEKIFNVDLNVLGTIKTNSPNVANSGNVLTYSTVTKTISYRTYDEFINDVSLVTKNTIQTITKTKEFTEGLTIKGYKYYSDDTKNLLVNSTNAFNNSYGEIADSAIGIGNDIFPMMSLAPYDVLTEPWNNKGYLGIGSGIYPAYLGNTNYRPDHNAHDSWIGVGRALGYGFLDGTNITMMGTTNMHRNTVKYADSVTIVGKGNTNDVTTNGSELDPDRVVTSVNGFPIRDMMKAVTIVGSENWFEDITDSVIVGSNTRIYKYIFNSVVIGNTNANYTGEDMSEAQKNQVLDCDVIIGSAVTKNLDRHAPSHNLLMGMGYFYNTGGPPNPLYRPLIEGRYKGATPSESASLQINGVVIAGHEIADTDSPNEIDIPFIVGTLPSGVTFDGENSFRFDGTQASTSFKIGEIVASTTEAYYIKIHADPHTAGSWGYSMNGFADSGNTAEINFTAVQSFVARTNSDFILTTADNFNGVITIPFKKTNLLGVGTLPNVILKDSSENITAEIRGGKIDNGHTSFGLNAGKFLYLGTDTLVIGKDAYSKATIGRTSVIIGNGAARNNPSTSRDVMIGNNVYENGDLGSGGNVLIGTDVIRNPTQRITGTTVVGERAFGQLKTGANNTGVGATSGAIIENGSNNFFGGGTAGFIKNGSNNTMLGYLAGGYDFMEATLNDTIVIGCNAVPESAAGNTTTIGTPANTDNYFYGKIHANTFKVRGGTSTQIMMADGSLIEKSTIVGTTYTNGTGLSLVGNTFSVNFGTTSTTSAVGNDSRINNGQTAFSWGNHNSAGYILSSQKGVANGVASLDANGLVLTTQLPSYVDDVIEAANLAALNSLPAGDKMTGKIYVALDTNKTYRWSGSSFVYITSGAVDSVAGKTGVVTLVKADVGLNLVANTADSSKNVLSATKLTTARNLTIGSSAKSFNGTANIVWTLAEIGAQPAGNYADSSHTHTFESLTSKPTTLSGYGITDANPHSHANKALLDTIVTNAAINIKTSALTLNPGSIETDTYGYYGGFLQNNVVGATNEVPINGEYFNKIKILHDNSAGYFTELAQSFTGEEGLWHRRMSNGVRSPWVKFGEAQDRVDNSYRKLLAFGPTTHSKGTITISLPFLSLVTSSTLKLKVSSLFQESNINGYIDIDFSFMNQNVSGFYASSSEVVSVVGTIQDYITVSPTLRFSGGNLLIDIFKQSTTDNTLYFDLNLMVPYSAQSSALQKTFARDILNGATISMASGLPPSAKNVTENVTINTAQTITSKKIFSQSIESYNSSNEYSGGALINTGNGSTIFPSIGFHQPGAFAGVLRMSDANTFEFRTNPSSSFGSIVAASFLESSQRKYKTNIKKFEKSGLDLINDLEIVTFDRKDSDIKNKIGIIADDAPKEFLSEKMSEVDLYKTIFVQAKAIQELTKRLEILENK